MSRNNTTGINPETGEKVHIAYGHDIVPGFRQGYFFQVFSLDPKVIEESDEGEGLLVNDGFLDGLTADELRERIEHWKVVIDFSQELSDKQVRK